MGNLALEKNAVRERTNFGFTLIETLAVILMIGILAAIAGPSWVRFINQQRVNAANDAIFRAIQDAQGQAKKEKLRYSISFITENTAQGIVPKFAIHPDSENPNWQRLGKNLEIKPGQLIIATNLDAQENKKATSPSSPYNFTTKKTITFDSRGNLPLDTTPDEGLIIAVGIPQSTNSSQPHSLSRRCVKVTTLLGSLQTGREEECNL